jgi:hypothetical protein
MKKFDRNIETAFFLILVVLFGLSVYSIITGHTQHVATGLISGAFALFFCPFWPKEKGGDE